MAKHKQSKLQKWKILDLHERSSIDLEKLLEEEKKRVVEKIKIQFGEGQDWVKALEISDEDMDKLLNINQFKEKEDEKIKSIISWKIWWCYRNMVHALCRLPKCKLDAIC